MSGIFLLLSTVILSETTADSCQGIKDDIANIQKHQYAIKNGDETLADLEKKFHMINAKFILLEGLMELKGEYLSFLEQTKDIPIDMAKPEIEQTLENVRDEMTKGTNAAVRLSTVYNFLKSMNALGDSDPGAIKNKCFEKMTSNYDGINAMKHLCEKLQGNDPVVTETLDGFITAYKQADDESFTQIMKNYVGEIPDNLLDRDTIGLLEGTRSAIDVSLEKYKECVSLKRPDCHKHFLLLQSSLEKIKNLTKDMDNQFDKKIFHTFLEQQFGKIETIDQSIKSYLSKTKSSDIIKKRSDILRRVRQNYNLAREKERMRRSMLGLSEQEDLPFDVGNLYKSLFDELMEKGTSENQDKDTWEDKDFILNKSTDKLLSDKSQFNLTMLSAFFDKIIDLESDALEKQKKQVQMELSNLAEKTASIKQSEQYTQFEREKTALISQIEESCREINIIKSRPCNAFPMESGVLQEESVLWNFIADNDDIVGEINKDVPSEEVASSPMDQICDQPSEVLKDSFTCGYNEYRKKQAYTVQLQNEINRNFYDNYYVGNDAQGRPVNYGKRRAFYEYSEVLGSGVGLGTSLIQLYYQGEHWKQNKESIINQYKDLKTHSWWQRQKCVNIFVYREYLCTASGYSYNAGYNPSFGFWPPNAQNFCMGCQ